MSSKKNTPKGCIAVRTHDQDVTKVEYKVAPPEGSGKHYNPNKNKNKI